MRARRREIKTNVIYACGHIRTVYVPSSGAWFTLQTNNERFACSPACDVRRIGEAK